MAFRLDQFDKKQQMMGMAGVTAIVMLLCCWLISTQTNSLQLWLYDTAQRHAPATAPSHVAIVAIDDASKSRLGEWPWSNNAHAKLVDILRGAGATGIAFTTPLYASNNSGDGTSTLTDADQRLIQAMQQAKVLLPLEVSSQITAPSDNSGMTELIAKHGLSPDATAIAAAKPAALISSMEKPLLQAAYGVGHMFSTSDNDGVTRREFSAVKVGNQLLPSLSVALAFTTSPGSDKQLTKKKLTT
ncbi:MAG TPA: CHASE2 domain-containing protein, partial [Steroidobacteraceae bacterium]|nr:CHASE2 domain-containing protein [Steroidobacteraceae bacterium]